MTVREDVLAAARRLSAMGGSPFTPAEIIEEARRAGTTYAAPSLRTHVVSYMCANAKGSAAGKWNDLVRVGRGRYRLTDGAKPTPDASSVASADPLTNAADPQADWNWEGNVQAAVVGYLAHEGWDIIRVADTASQERGIDIEARRSGERLAVEVKGFPSTRYVRGPRRGQPKPTSPTLQARHWYANAMLTALLLASDDARRRTVVALPEADTYRRLTQRTATARTAAGIEIWFVDVAGTVRMPD